MFCKNLMYVYFVNYKFGLNDVWRVDVDWFYYIKFFLLYYSVDIFYMYIWLIKKNNNL